MGGFNISKREIRGDSLPKKILASLSALALTLGLCLSGLLVTPLTARADGNPGKTYSELQSLTYAGISQAMNDVEGYKYVGIPATMVVDNKNNSSDGSVSYVPNFLAIILATPVMDGDFLPDGYKTSHPQYSDTGRRALAGVIGTNASLNVTFGDDGANGDPDPLKYKIEGTTYDGHEGIYPSGAVSRIGYQDSWYSSCDDGTYRYQLSVVEFLEQDKFSYGEMFTLPDMDTAGNRMFLDMYVKNGTVKAVVLVDEDNNKMAAFDDGGEGVPEETTVEPSIGGASGGIIYNVLNLEVSNTTLGKATPSYTYAGAVIRPKDIPIFPGPTNFTMGKQTDTTGTYSNGTAIGTFGLSYTPGTDQKGFTYYIKNYPLTWNVVFAQETQEDVQGKIQVYAKDAARWTDFTVEPADWIANIAERNRYIRIRNNNFTLTYVSPSNNKIGFVNAVLESTPETGIALQVLPFIIMAAGAGVLLLFVMRRRADK